MPDQNSNKTIILSIYIFLLSLTPGDVCAESPEEFCRKRASIYVTDAQIQYTQTEISGVDANVRSLAVSVRRCMSQASSITFGGYFDDIDIDDRNSNSGRILIGYLGIIDDSYIDDVSGYWVYGANLTAGYEDYYIAEGWPPTFRRDRRWSTSAEAIGGFAFTPEVDRLKQATGVERVYLEWRTAVFDKRAPSANAPPYANERYQAVSGSVVVTQFFDHSPLGSKVDYFLIHQHLFSETLVVRDISTTRIQWRPQQNEAVWGVPDLLTVGAQFSIGNNDYRSFSVSIGRSF